MKKIIYIFVFLFIIFGMISMVSAKHAWWHVWGDEPELAPFNATVTVQSVAPKVLRVFNVSDDYGSSLVNYVQPTAGGSSNVYVVFLGHDDNGPTDLPSGAITLGVGGDININITYGGNGFGGIRADSTSYTASSIAGDWCVALPCNGPICNSANERMYLCNLSNSMDYWEQPNVNLSAANPNLWAIGITLKERSSGQVGINNTFNFSYLELPAVDNVVNLVWTGISPSGTNQKATDNVTLINLGNKFIKAVNMTAYNLTGATYTAGSNKYIPAMSIRSSGVIGTECSAIAPATTLRENALTSTGVQGLSLPFGGPVQQSRPIFFCIYPDLTNFPQSGWPGGLNLGDSPYTANGLYTGVRGTADWRICYDC